MKAVEGKMSDLIKRQEELADQLVFQSPERDAALPGQKAEKARPFGFLTLSYCETLATFIAFEHPQLIALVLSYLEPGLAACVLERLPLDMQTNVTERICTLERTSPEVLREIERVLEKKMAAISSADYVPAGGIAAVVEILNVSTRGLEKFVVETLEKGNPGLAEEIKKRMFVFEDIVLLDRQTATRVLAEVAEDDLLLSLKATEQKVEDFVWECVVPARVQALKERLTKMGRARLSDVDAAQQRIVGVIRRMDEEGLIVVARPGETVD
jgi:flagellar motor switch protein FliG